MKVSGEDDATYSFKITPEMAPNFYVHVTLIQPHERGDNDLPIRLYGVRPILVNDKASHLEPVINMPDVLRPEEEFTVKVKEKNGKPMTYTLAVVDEGLLDITGYKTPDPWNAMYAREALGVSTWDLYDDVIGAYSGRFSPMFSIGGDESMIVGAKKDNRFNAVVRYIGPFSLQSGTATHKIKLPMYVGSVKVMLVAGRSGAYGNAEKTVTVRSPLMVLPTLPRVLGTGEKVSMPVNVFALENEVKDAEVTVTVDGPLRINGDSRAVVTFSEPGDKLVRFNLEATGTGVATVNITAASKGHKAKDRITIQVRTPNPPIVSVERAVIPKDGTKHFGFKPFTSGDEQWATLEFTGFPAVDCGGIFTFLKGYDYSCSEQIASRGISLLAIKDMLPEDKRQEIDKMIPELLQSLYQRQLGGGGFTYWPGGTDANGWVSSMAGQFMIAALENGFSVSKGVLASWSRFQKKNVQDYRNTTNTALGDLEQAYRLYTLALNGEAESGAMNRLKESESLSTQAAWMLASTYAITGKKTVAKEIIEGLRTDFSEYAQANSTFGSPVRDKAIAIESMVLTDAIPEAMDVAQEVADAISGGWYSTQELAFTTNALKKLAAKVGSDNIAAEVRQGDKTASVKSAKSIGMATVDTECGSIDITNKMNGLLYATLVTSVIPEPGSRVEARSNGLSLSVAYSSLSGKTLTPEKIQQGTDFNVTITVGNTSGAKDYTNLALTEAIPSGWEIINDRLLGQGASKASFTYKDIRDDRVIWFFDLPKGSSKTFRMKMHASYLGEFTLPAIKCEAMYDPHIVANTASGTAKVTE